MIWQSWKRPEGSEKEPREIWNGFDPAGGNLVFLVADGLPKIRGEDVVIQCVEATDEDIDATIHLSRMAESSVIRIDADYDWDGNAV